MGLKTFNYEVKKLGITVPTAYAIIRNMEIHGSKGKAEFIIQSTRETTKTKEPLERFYLDFCVNRNENPYITAYNTAKGTVPKLVIEEIIDENAKETRGRLTYAHRYIKLRSTKPYRRAQHEYDQNRRADCRQKKRTGHDAGGSGRHSGRDCQSGFQMGARSQLSGRHAHRPSGSGASYQHD